MATIDKCYKEHSYYQKYHLTKMAANINGISHPKNGISQLTLGIDFLKLLPTLCLQNLPLYIQIQESNRNITLERKNSILKSRDHESKSYNKFKNSLYKYHSAQPIENNLWAFFHKMCHFCKASFFMGAIFVFFRWSIYHVLFL